MYCQSFVQKQLGYDDEKLALGIHSFTSANISEHDIQRKICINIWKCNPYARNENTYSYNNINDVVAHIYNFDNNW